jgi:hypothetical protein
VIFMQQAYAAGVLTAAQPGVTLVDPVFAVALGIFLFHERIMLGGLLIVELLGVLLVIIGAIELSRSPLSAGEPADSRPGDSDHSDSDHSDSDPARVGARAPAARRGSSA